MPGTGLREGRAGCLTRAERRTVLIVSSHVPLIGLALCALGAAAIAVGAIAFLMEPSSGLAYRQRRWTVVGAVLMTVGFLVQLAGRLAG